jgi:HlyD family secretion protein
VSLQIDGLTGLLGLVALTGLASCDAAPVPAQGRASEASQPRVAAVVSARGRLEPGGKVQKIAGPSDFVVVVSRVEVAEGEMVKAGQVLAVTDTYELRQARIVGLRARIAALLASITRIEAELENARIEDKRRGELNAQGVVAPTERDAARARRQETEASLLEARSQLEVGQADIVTAEADAAMSIVRAPRAGQVLKLHTRAGEKVGPEGILDLADTSRMYAIAEVYETDIARVKPGQRARVRSAALPHELLGTVERVGLSVGRLASLGTDPVLKSDARVVEVDIRLDDSAAAAMLTNLEVEVLIGG